MQIHDEQHIKKKSINTQGKSKNTWSLRNNNRPNDKGKEFEEDMIHGSKANQINNTKRPELAKVIMLIPNVLET